MEYCSTLCSHAVNSTYSFGAIKEVIEVLCDVCQKIETVISTESIGITENNIVFSFVFCATRKAKFDINVEILIHVFKVQLTAEMLKVSKRTIFGCLQEFPLATSCKDRDVSNDELDREIRIAAQEFPFYGIRRSEVI